MRRLIEHMYRPVDSSSLAAFRIAFGALMFISTLLYQDAVLVRFAPHEFRPYYEWLRFLGTRSPDQANVVFLLMVLSSAGLTLGLLTRTCAAVFGALFAYVHLLDPSVFNNHYYLIVLLSFCFAVTASNADWSLDARFRPKLKRRTVPAWHIWLFRGHFALAYFFGGLVKLNSDWLHAHPLKFWVTSRGDVPLLGPLLTSDAGPWVLAYGGLLYDLSIAFLLLCRRTRALGIALTLSFHLVNSQIFEIGVFPWLGIAGLLVFLEPETPRNAARWLSRAILGISPKPDTGLPASGGKIVLTPRRRCLVVAIAVYACVQLLLPFRHYLYAGWVEWNGEGGRFAWRMMLSDKQCFLDVRVIDAENGNVWEVDQGGVLLDLVRATPGVPVLTEPILIEEGDARILIPTRLLRHQQTRRKVGVWSEPRLTAQYARFVAEEARRAGIARPEVRAHLVASLNGRPFQFLIDPDVDLATADVPVFATPDWIVPLIPDRSPRDYPDDMDELQARVMRVIEERRREELQANL